MNTAIILAGGSSTRFKDETPKQFYKICGKPLLAYTLDAFETSSDINQIVIVANEEYRNLFEEFLEQYRYKKILHIVSNGKNRQESSFYGLLSIEKSSKPGDIVIIHDGARPLVSHKIIHQLIEALKDHHGATTALKSVNTMSIVDKENMEMVGILNRDEIFAIQTPQAFRYDSILEAHKMFVGKNASDDAQLLNCFTPIKIIEGDVKLLKVTTREDILLIETLLRTSKDD